MQLLPHSFDWMILIYGILSAFLAVFVGYIIKPGEVFGDYSYVLAKWKLKRMGVLKEYEEGHDFTDRSDKVLFIFHAAESSFTWEKAVGMCIICTGFWISLLSGFFYRFTPVPIIEIVLISHVTIRILTKLL